MNKIERVKKAFSGDKVDRVPVSMWFHFSGDDRFDERYVETHYEYYKQSNIDFLKMMNDAFFPYVIEEKISKASDWRNLRPRGKNDPFIYKQVEYAKRLNDKLKGDCLTFWSIFAPFSSMRFTVGDPMVTNHLREDPESVIEGMKVIAEEGALISRLTNKEGGCSGTYIALHSADYGRYTTEEYEKWIKPQDLMVIDAINEDNYYSIAHLCGWSGIKNNIAVWKDYPVTVFNWAATIEDLGLKDAREYFKGKTVMGGFDSTTSGVVYKGNKDEIKEETKRLIREVGIEGFILGADCTLPSDINYEHVKWVVEATTEI